jgi:hypothetical protein
MAEAPLNQLTYLGIDRPTLGYRTNTSPVDESPHFVEGSQNIMGTIKGEVEKRPGFSTPIETILSAIPGTVVRLYTWRRFSGSFFVMASVTTQTKGSLSQVWKLEVGVDQSFSMIYADTTSTTASAFDFVTSNNFCFFGNATTRQNMQKFNGTDVVPGIHTSLWGLDFPAAPPARALITGSFPAGLAFNGTTLSGTPTSAGTYSINFTATDTGGGTASQSLTFTISPNILDYQFPSGPIQSGEKGSAYTSNDVQAWGGTAPYTYALSSGTLPPGITISSSTGVVSGNPTTAGDFSFSIKVTDSASSPATVTREFSIFVGNPALSLTPPTPNTGTVGIAYSSVLAVSGGTAPYVYAVAGGSPPPGIFMDNLGNVTGTPTVSGVYPVIFQVTDANQLSNEVTVTYTISSNVLAIATNPAPPAGKVGYPYTFTPLASGGNGSQTLGSPTNTATGDWQFVSPNFETINEPVVTSLGDLVLANYGFAIPVTATILGIEVSAVLTSQNTTVATLSQIALYSAGAAIGTTKNPATPFTNIGVTQTYGSSTDTWGATLTPAIINSSTFGFSPAVNQPDGIRVFIGQPFQMTVYYAYPSSGITLTAAPNALTAQTGYIYGQTFTSMYGHESAMSSLSASTGIFTNLNIRVNVLSSSDPQVNGINIYRTTDGGDSDPQAMRLVASLTNTDAAYIDTTIDTNLGLQTGPALYVNDPPQPLNGFVWSNGRIWGKTGAYTWFTGNEEITNGIPAECMSDATNGNYYGWPSQVGGMAVTSNGVDIGLSEQFWQISGDTLATFRKSKLLQGGGTLFPINIMSVGDSVIWIDSAKQAFSSSAGEFGEPIRPDLSKLDPSQSFVVFHKSKLYNWMVILDVLNSTLYVYDLDLSQWNCPWVFDTPVTAITSGEVTSGNVELLVAFGSGHVLYLTPDSFVDDNQTYGESLISNLLPIVPGRGTTARNAAEVRQIAQFDMEVSMVPGTANDFIARSPEFFACLVDDDPAQTAQEYFFDLSSNLCPPQYQDRTIQKRYIAPLRWPVDQAVPHGRRIAFYAQWDPSPNGWNLYSMDVAWRT